MLKRSLATVTCSALLAFVFAPAAQAQDPDLESYGAGASATALVLEILDQAATFSSTGAAVGSEPEAAADGQAAAIPPLFETPGAPVQSTGPLVEGDDCAVNEDLPAPLDVLGLDIACVHTAAEVADGSPEASSLSDEIVLDIISAELVGQATDDLLRPLLTELLAGIATPLAQLEAIPGLADLVPSLDALITLLLNDLSDGGSLATVTVAPTSSTADEVEGLATAQGAVVDILPGLLPGIGSLAQVTVGDSFSSATFDPVTGEVVTDGEAAFLDVELTGLQLILGALLDNVVGALTEPLPAPLDELAATALGTIGDLIANLDDEVEGVVNVTVDQLACPDSPLAAVLCFEAGTVNELDAAGLASYGFDAFGEGTEGIESTMLGLSVLDGTLELGIGQTAAAANAVPADDTGLPGDPPAAPPRGNLPTTGADDMLPVTLALFAAAVAGITLIRRTRSV